MSDIELLGTDWENCDLDTQNEIFDTTQRIWTEETIPGDIIEKLYDEFLSKFYGDDWKKDESKTRKRDYFNQCITNERTKSQFFWNRIRGTQNRIGSTRDDRDQANTRAGQIEEYHRDSRLREIHKRNRTELNYDPNATFGQSQQKTPVMSSTVNTALQRGVTTSNVVQTLQGVQTLAQQQGNGTTQDTENKQSSTDDDTDGITN